MNSDQPKKIAVAVQGGGSHGAFSWGVLDRLLDEVVAGRLTITALSGTSAGGFNAALAAYGLGSAGGPDQRAAKAKALLHNFWMSDAAFAPLNPYSGIALAAHMLTGSWNIDALPAVRLAEAFGTLWSPYYQPTIDWLKLALRDSIDFAALRAQADGPELYITATNINHNRRDTFARDAITFDVLAASAAIPSLFRAHQITRGADTDYYWDGGYMGNPAIAPMVDTGSDIVVIQVNPFERPDSPPRSPPAILDRLNQITFNSSLILELSNIESHNHRLATANAAPTFLHCIHNEPFMQSLGYASKSVIVGEFLEFQRDEGFETANRWLAENYDKLGHESTLDPLIGDRIIHVTTAKDAVLH